LKPTGDIVGTNGDDLFEGTSGADVIIGLDGQDMVNESAGNDRISLGDGYDQVNYDGAASDYNFIRNSDGSITVTKPGGGVDILEGVDGVWFDGEGAWYSPDALVVDLGGNDETITGTIGDDQLNGTDGDDIFESLNGQDVVFGSGGNDLIELGDDYDQIVYEGAAEDYTITRNDDGSLTVIKPDGAIDTLIGVDGFWFNGEAAWYSSDVLAAPGGENGTITGTNGDDQLQGTDGNDFINGLEGEDIIIASEGSDTITLGDGYDQVNYAGSASDYIIMGNADGTITITKPGGGIDTLEGVDGFWFDDEAAWYSAADLAVDLFGLA